MPTLVPSPTVIAAAGEPPKRIEEFIGKINTATAGVSIARMQSPPGWSEPGQCPEFDEYTVVLKGKLVVRSRQGMLEVGVGQAVIAFGGEWVQYSTPEGAEYIAVCVPAFTADTVHRDPEREKSR
jgi:hypothetical protein